MLVYNYIILDLSPIFSFYTILQPPWVVCIIVWLAFWYMISTPCFPSKPLQATSDTVRSIAWGVCTTHICDHQILKTSLVSTRPLDSPWCTGCHLMILNGKFNGRKVVFFFIVGAHNFTVDMMLAHVSHCQMSFDLEVIDGVMIHDWLDLMCLLT